KTPLADVIKAGETDPPSWLNASHHDAWRHMWRYQPPYEEALIRKEQHEARDLRKGGVSVAEKAGGVGGGTYLLRSILVGHSDTLVALRVASLENNGDVVLVWKVLKKFDTPTMRRN